MAHPEFPRTADLTRPWHHEQMDALGDYGPVWQLATALVLLGALVFLILAYRRRNRRD